ncbi:hypothetical protein MnTg02_01354 [bacterium MnTg02]|nr:hypothetical protein MnTg02_01354 [bacterium MnTg02]
MKKAEDILDEVPIHVTPAGLVKLTDAAKFYDVSMKTMRKVVEQDKRLSKIQIGGRIYLRFEQLQQIAMGET